MRETPSFGRRLAVAGLTTACALALAAPAAAQTGGTGAPGTTTTDPTTTTPTPDPSLPLAPPGKAKLRKDGTAVAPADAPPAVQAAIAAGNAIHAMPYRWGGGHRDFLDTGYDCSGAVSYVLHGAGLITSPLTSGGFASSWGIPGKGRWITVYGNAGHVYMVVAGLRYDTSAVGERLNQGSGPRWRKTKRKALGYTAKYAAGY